MKLKSIFVTLCFSIFMLMQQVVAQTTKPKNWDLKTCIAYAKENNIQVQKSKISTESSTLTLKQSKEALYPSLSAGSSLSFSNGKYKADSLGNYKNNASLGSNYSLSAGMTLFNGMRNYNAIKQNQLLVQSSALNSKIIENDITVSITEAYLNILYANENLITAKRTVETSKAQVDLSKNLLDAESITKADFSQVQSQYANDRYTQVSAENNLETCKLTLKQLLELDMLDEFEVVIPEIREAEVLKLLPAKADVYQIALYSRPEIKNNELSVQIADIDLKNAKSSYYPTLSLSGGLSTSHDVDVAESLGAQLNHNFRQSLGLSLSVPIYSNGSTRTNILKSKLSIRSSKLDLTSAKKTLLKTVESLYLDAVASQSKYLAAKEQLSSAKESYSLTRDQFELGMKNTVELLTAQANYLSAEQTLTQAKYAAVLSQKLLLFYQNTPIEL